jgi:hypothetical protein
MVGLADFQKDISLTHRLQLPQQPAGNSAPPKPGCHGKVEQLALRFGNRARGEKSTYAALTHRYQKVVPQIVRGVPLRSVRAGLLDGRHFRQISRLASAENWHTLVDNMRALVTLLFFLAQPFWEVKPPEEWTFAEIGILRSNSPWAQRVGPAQPVLMYLATAAPIEEAESELRVRSKSPARELDPDYAAYIVRSRDQNLVLAIPYSPASLAKLGRAEEQRKLEEESVMLIGRGRRYKMVGHFPPTPSDPILRLVFPREVRPTDKTVVFRVYLPGVDFPDREIEFPVKDLMYRGKLEM